MDDPTVLIRRLTETVVEAAAKRRARPTATYRVQFAAESMTFAAATRIVSYLDALGISHFYASPCLKSPQGTSGYAIVDYGQLNPALGSDAEFHALAGELRHRGMGLILDMVPNHMSNQARENRWWRDVLENGPSSPYAAYFDIDWSPVNDAMQGKVLLPLLGEQYGKVLETGDLRLEYRDGTFSIRYYDMNLPLDPRSYRQVLLLALPELRQTIPAESEDLRELESIVTALEHLPPREETAPALVAERQREKEVIKNRLGKLTERSQEIADFVAGNVAQFRGRAEDPRSFDLLDGLLEAQVYRLSHWKAAADEINYRRFFDINELAAVCMEEPRVFDESHRLIFELLVSGEAEGLRIDHIDGLYDPQAYLNRLQLEYLRGLGRAAFDQIGREGEATVEPVAVEPITARQEPRPPGEPSAAAFQLAIAEATQSVATLPFPAPLTNDVSAEVAVSVAPEWRDLETPLLRELGSRFEIALPLTDPIFQRAAEMVQWVVGSGVESEPAGKPPLYVLVEKILGPEEPIPTTWPVAGTTGYDFANVVGGVLIDPAGFVELQKTYQRFVGETTAFREVAYQSKGLILRVAMSSDLQLLAHRLNRLSERHRHYRDFTLNELRAALREVMACFPVYRTYIRQGEVSEQDRQFIHRAAAQAKRRNPARNPALFDFIRDVLLLLAPPALDDAGQRERALFVGRFQQTTSPVTAKGIEDTAFYRYFPLVTLCEVGGDPSHGATPLEEFHRQNLRRQNEWPQSLLATSTHDTKRSEDVRARINVLSEIPTLWRAAVNRWSRLNRRHQREVEGGPAPSRNDEYLFYQTLVGVWPLEPPDGEAMRSLTERMQQCMEKATREAKVRTSWINPVVDYDAAVREFTAAVLQGGPKNRFLAAFRAFHEQIVNWGLFGALSQVLLKLTSPGVPDIYQGQEFWDFSLVDPDNRRPVDFAVRQNMLAQLEEAVGENDEALATLARSLAGNPRDSRLKLFVTWRALQSRRLRADLFAEGEYLPLAVEGAAAKHVVAFARRWMPPGSERPQVAVAAVPRWIVQLMKSAPEVAPTSPPVGGKVWGDTRIDATDLGNFAAGNVFTGRRCAANDGTIAVAELFADFPVALLMTAE
jgi:(1->4)-alpha-D-glucan 1-alpha-D-glucosylmutase